MQESIFVRDLEFDGIRRSKAIFVRLDTDPQVILDALQLNPFPKGVISISGGANGFPPVAVEKMEQLLEEVIVPLAYANDLYIVDGGTQSGIMEITGRAFGNRYSNRIILGGEDETQSTGYDFSSALLLGFVPEPKVVYPGAEQITSRDATLDPNHLYFVLILDAEDWGQEVECMFSFLDYLAVFKQLPIMNIVANGGRITLKEAYHAVKNGWQIVVLDGTQRATQVIIAVLDGAPKSEWTSLLDKYDIQVQEHEVEETLHWLNSIAQYDKIVRFDLLLCPLEELGEIILTGLGLV